MTSKSVGKLTLFKLVNEVDENELCWSVKIISSTKSNGFPTRIAVMLAFAFDRNDDDQY